MTKYTGKTATEMTITGYMAISVNICNIGVMMSSENEICEFQGTVIHQQSDVWGWQQGTISPITR